MMQPIRIHRPTRSFVRRDGRITSAQKRGLELFSSQFGISLSDPPTVIQPDCYFARAAPTVLEIGFGNGESLLDQAERQSHCNFIGIEVHRPGVGHLLHRIDALGIDNVRVICADAAVVLNDYFRANSLDRIQVFFPDPWPKKRHHKRRLIQQPFVTILATCLKQNGILHIATDWEPYAEHILAVLRGEPQLNNTAIDYAPRPKDRPQTRFERRGLQRGHSVYDLMFRKKSHSKEA